FFSSRRRHTRCYRDWSSDVCSSDLSAHVSRRWAGRTAIETAPSGRRRFSIDPLHEDARMATLLALIGAIWFLTIVVAGAAGVFEIGRASCRARGVERWGRGV